MADKKTDLVQHVDKDRREFLEKVIKTSVFTVPVVLGASTLLSRKAYAQEASTQESGGGEASESGQTPGGGAESGMEGGAESGAESGMESGAESGAESGMEGGAESGMESTGVPGGSVSSDDYIPPPPSGGGPVSVPEPGALGLLGLGIAAIEIARRARASGASSQDDDNTTES